MRQLEAESEWIASSPRRAKPNPRPASAYEDLVQKQNDKAPTAAQIVIPVAERLAIMSSIFHISRRFWRHAAHRRSSFKLPPVASSADRPNGAGKTTLFRMIIARKSRLRTIEIGESVHLGYVDQSRDSLDPKKMSGRDFRRQ